MSEDYNTITPRLQDPHTYQSYAVVDTQGLLLVKGIEKWIGGLGQIVIVEDEINGPLWRMKDADTGAEFLIRRVK